MTEEPLSWSSMTMAEKVELVKKLYGEDGGSMGAIAGRVSNHLRERVSRSAIVGLYGRNPALKITHPFTGVRMSKAVANTLSHLPTPPKAPRAKKVKLTPPTGDTPSIVDRAKPARPHGEPKSLELTLLELDKDTCRWPTSVDPARFCGCQTARLSSYCAFHHKVSWEPAPTRSRKIA